MMFGTDEYQGCSPEILQRVKHALYDSIDDLLAPETLLHLTGLPVNAVRCNPMDGGYSGSQLLAVETSGEQPQRFVLKRMSPQNDWLMQASNDDLCRSVRLWQRGLLDQLHPTVDHATLACARDGDGWAILMRDVSSNLMMSREAWPEAEIKFFLDTLAAIHATFWESPELTRSVIGLCDTTEIIQTFSAESNRGLPGDGSPFLGRIVEGWEPLKNWLDPDVIDTIAALMENPQPLCRALTNYPATLVHGDYRPANMALQPGPESQAILLDWQLAGCSVPTIDLFWFLNSWEVGKSSFSVEAGIDYYRQGLETRLGNRFDPAQWQPMLELGRLVHILRFDIIRAWNATHTPVEANRVVERKTLEQRNAQVRAAMRWL